MEKLTHFRRRGEVAMVDVTSKDVTERTALARGFVRMSPAVLRALRGQKLPKGNPLEIARIAGIAAAKRTSEWIPLCHPLPLTHIDVTARLCKNGVEIASRVSATARPVWRWKRWWLYRRRAHGLRYVQGPGQGHGNHRHRSRRKNRRQERPLPAPEVAAVPDA
jgi:molybdenum cofactor biosynthesis protein MoaC